MTDRMLDGDAVERVLRRAGDLAEHDQELLQRGGVSETALVEAAAEVGIPAADVRRALAIERLDPPPRPRAADRLVGAAVVAVDAEVIGSPADVLTQLDAWFVAGHHLRRDRLRNGHGVWTKRTGIVGRAVRSVRFATGEGRLGRVRRVRVSAGDTGVGTTVVRVEADRTRARRTVAAGAAFAGVATVGSIVLAVFAAPVLAVAAPVGLAAGAALAGGGRSRANSIVDELDRVLDAVDEGVSPTRLRADVARRAIGRPRPRTPVVS